MTDVILPNAWELECQLNISGDTWRNTISVAASVGAGETPPDPTSSVATDWAAFMEHVHFPDTTIESLTLRPAIQRIGPTPGVENPPIWTLPIGTTGTGNTTFGGAHFSGYLPKDAAIYCKKATSGGRSGKNYLRNILTEADVQSSLDGQWVFSSHAGGFDLATFNATAASDLGANLHTTAPSTGYYYCVLHLMHLKVGDTRSARITPCSAFTAIAPTWNKARR